ncbi:MAG: hypothetical protein ACPG4N_03470, partial [Gammaproteobacteria bacterium]
LGNHIDGIGNSTIVWGENDFSSGSHSALKEANGGINVFVSVESVPTPAGYALLLGGLILIRAHRRHAKTAIVSSPE